VTFGRTATALRADDVVVVAGGVRATARLDVRAGTRALASLSALYACAERGEGRSTHLCVPRDAERQGSGRIDVDAGSWRSEALPEIEPR
jgi:hypothetical protein